MDGVEQQLAEQQLAAQDRGAQQRVSPFTFQPALVLGDMVNVVRINTATALASTHWPHRSTLLLQAPLHPQR